MNFKTVFLSAQRIYRQNKKNLLSTNYRLDFKYRYIGNRFTRNFCTVFIA